MRGSVRKAKVPAAHLMLRAVRWHNGVDSAAARTRQSFSFSLLPVRSRLVTLGWIRRLETEPRIKLLSCRCLFASGSAAPSSHSAAGGGLSLEASISPCLLWPMEPWKWCFTMTVPRGDHDARAHHASLLSTLLCSVYTRAYMYPEEGTTAGALQHSYCGHYEWILAARVVWGVFHVVWERGCTRER